MVKRRADVCTGRGICADGEWMVSWSFWDAVDHQVKVRGYRVELGEIETVLEEHPHVRRGVVTGGRGGTEERRLTAYVEWESGEGENGAKLETSELRDYLRARLPEYMVPAVYVKLEEIPLSPSGKVDRKALPAPERVRPESLDSYVGARTAEEEKLVRVWQEVLGVEPVGVHDNFFELGGDSILSIQVVSRAQRDGLQLTPRQLFEHQTIAELALVAGTRPAVSAEQGEVEGPVVLTPVQRWFLEQEHPDPDYFNQSLFLDLNQSLNPGHLRRALSHLLSHHDALRLRLKRGESGWQQRMVPVSPIDVDRVFVHVDLRAIAVAPRRSALEASAAQLQASLDLSHGPLLRVAHFEMGDGSERLLIAIHHMAVDGVSWRILLQDLMTAYGQSLKGRAIELPPKTTSFQEWARRLEAYSQSAALDGETSYWMDVCEGVPSSAPFDLEGANDVATSSSVMVTLSAEETRALLHEVPAAYRTQINDVLLTALAQAFGKWTGETSLRIDLEGHGREEIFEDVDLSRTVGWFTTIVPIRLSLDGASSPPEALMAVKEQLRRVPRRGIGHGLLRYLRGDRKLAQRLGLTANVSFNYLGQFDQTLSADLPLKLASESGGSARSRRGSRSYLIDVSGGIGVGQLRMVFSYSDKLYRRETIERLGTHFMESLQSVIAHCTQTDAGGCTPSDFPLAQLDRSALERLVGTGREIEDLYPATPLQSGLLFHNLYAPTLGEYFEQITCTLEGELDAGVLRRAWQGVVDDVSVLRTGFLWREGQAPLQAVYRKAALRWEELDWREVPVPDQLSRIEVYLEEDRALGFDLERPPLMRFALVRLSDSSWRLIWSFHHALLDGWSLSLLIKSVMLTYQGLLHGIRVPFQGSGSYRDYIEWPLDQDEKRAEAYWRRTLAGFLAPVRLLAERSQGSLPMGEREFDGERILVPATVTESLHALSRRHRLNLNSVVQGAWAVLLSRYSAEDDVVFGAASSGRSAAVRGIENMLGFFVSVLPVRARVSSQAPLLAWLSEHQAQQVNQREYEYSSLVDIRKWSDVPRGIPLFEIAFVFENYPVDRSFTEMGHEGPLTLRARDFQIRERFNYALTLMVGAQKNDLSLRIMYDRRRFEDVTITRMLRHMRALLEGIAERPEARLSEISCLTSEEREQILVAWNQTTAAYPASECLHELSSSEPRPPRRRSRWCWETSVSATASWTRAPINWPDYLRDFGVGPETLVGISVERSLGMIAGVLAVPKPVEAFVLLVPRLPDGATRRSRIERAAGRALSLSPGCAPDSRGYEGQSRRGG